jgi:predicted permease
MTDLGSAAVASTSIAKNPAVQAATRAALELVVSSGLGIASIDRGLLDATTIKALSRTTFTILLPLFLGTSILKTITKYGLSKSSLAVPALAVIQSFVLYGMTTRFLYPLVLAPEQRDTDDARGTAVCASFGNAGVVPLIFCDSLFRKSASQNDHLALSTGFVSMFLVGWSPFFWSYGRSVLLGGGEAKSTSPATRSRRTTPSLLPTQRITKRKEELLSFAKTLLPPPVMGVLIGMVVATIPILRRLFLGDASSSSTVAPLGVVFDTAQNFGKAASPLSLLVLVSSLALGAGFGTKNQPLPSPPPQSKRSDDPVGATTTNTATTIPFWKRWALVSFSRFVVSPSLMLGLLKAASAPRLWGEGKGWIGTSAEQPMLWFVCLLESCMPPAQNQVMMLQVANKMKQANEMATFLFSVYATSMIPLTVVISIALDRFGLI